eukprot:14015-Eustigmatos_ZCMA.PRE.1
MGEKLTREDRALRGMVVTPRTRILMAKVRASANQRHTNHTVEALRSALRAVVQWNMACTIRGCS